MSYRPDGLVKKKVEPTSQSAPDDVKAKDSE